MRKHIENLQAQHPQVKTRFAVTAAFGLTALVALVWVTTLPIRFGEISGGGLDTAAAIQAAGEAVAPQTQAVQTSFEAFQGLQLAPNPQSNAPSETAPADEYPAAVYDGQ